MIYQRKEILNTTSLKEKVLTNNHKINKAKVQFLIKPDNRNL